MTAIATISRPPTEAEIRDTLASHVANVDMDFSEGAAPIFEPAWQAAGHTEPGDAPGQPKAEWDALWWDLPPSQATRLWNLVTDAMERAQNRARAILLDELTAAGVTFATEHPDAPRP